MRRLSMILSGAVLAGAGVLAAMAGASSAGAAEPCAAGTVQYTLASGATACAPATGVPAPLLRLPDRLLDPILGSGSGTSQCSPGAVVTVLGTTYTCPAPATAAVPVAPTPKTVTNDLVVTH